MMNVKFKYYEFKSVWVVYIGLNDYKNAEIHEGDIVKTNLDGIDYIGEIVYKAPSFCLKIREENGECAHSYLEQWHDGVRIEVLGNVYENAEILNQKHI